MSHNFHSRYARKSFKDFKDSDLGLVSKQILSLNNGPMGWGPGPGKGGQKKAKSPLLAAVPQRTPKPKTKTVFFSISSRRPAESEDGLNSSLAQSGIGWRVTALQTGAKILADAWLKGIFNFRDLFGTFKLIWRLFTRHSVMYLAVWTIYCLSTPLYRQFTLSYNRQLYYHCERRSRNHTLACFHKNISLRVCG